MDYLRQGTLWKAAKVLRYLRLYGAGRTLAKVRAQIHMRRRYEKLPPSPRNGVGRGHVGIIGCGGFSYSTIAYYLKRNYGFVIRGCMDTDVHRAASLFQSYGLYYYTDRAADIFSDPAIDLVYIASNHASHADYAVEALLAGKAVHIEKPHCVSEEQLRHLCGTIRETGGKVALGFNRPASRFGELIREHLEEQPGAAMFNWFIAGHRIDPAHWYFRPEEGGRVLGNLCHWTDFVYQLVPADNRFPILITPTRAERSDSDIAVTFTFGDGTIAAFTFSAKGHTFEGVRERFAAHKGDLLVSLDDFKTLRLDVLERKQVFRSRHRDHGHERRIRDSYVMVRSRPGADVAYVWETGQLFLKTREALESRREIIVDSYERTF